MPFALTAIRYLQRKHYLPTRTMLGRFQTRWLKTHSRPVGLPIVPMKPGSGNAGLTEKWLDPIE